MTWRDFCADGALNGRERVIRTAHIIRDRMHADDQQHWGDGKLSYPKAVELLEFYHRGTWFSFDIDRYGDKQRIAELEAEVERLRREKA
jgi:hypothetical protein